MRRGLLTVTCASVGLAAGCSLITSLDDLARDGGIVADAALDAPADVMVDAAPDADANVDADADASPSFCPVLDAGIVFCDDFDESDASVFPEWSKLVASGGGAVARTASDASSPFCVEMTLPPQNGGPQAELAKSFLSGPTTRAVYSFQLRVVRFPGNGSRFNVAPVELAGSAAAGATDFFAFTSSGASFTEQFPIDGGFQTLAHPLTHGLTEGVWVAVSITWDIADAGVTATITFDGQPVTSPIALDARTVFGIPYVIAGLSYEDGVSDGVDVQIDDVVVTLE